MAIDNISKDYFIYIRTHEAYDIYNAIKLGITTHIAERDSAYTTGEIKRGKFILVIRVSTFSNEVINHSRLKLLEKLIQDNFRGYHILADGGKEFFKKDIISLVLPFLDSLDIVYNILADNELLRLIKLYKLKQIIIQHSKKITNTLKKWLARIKLSKQSNPINYLQPNPHQLGVLSQIEAFYQTNNVGQLRWACGLGKALLAVFIVKHLQCKSIVIGVPSIYLQTQIKKEIIKIFPTDSNILCVGGNDKSSTTAITIIKEFLEEETINPKFVITTYDSCNVLTTLEDNYYFDMKIGDECHHLVSIDENDTSKSYIKFHSIHSRKTLFMTATQKNIKNINISKNNICQNDPLEKEDPIIYSMDDETIFGKVIDTKSIKWAIENNKITDYKVLVLYNTITEINTILTKYKIKNVKHMELFVSAFMTLKSILKYPDLTHVLIYTNTTENSDIVSSYIDLILSRGLVSITRDDLYFKALHSNSRDVKFNDEVNKFRNARYGIISCVYIFGEGFDLPRLNGVAFAENMISPIRMTQCAMRPNRLDRENPQKIAYVIIPYLDMEEHGIYNKSFQKCYNILDKLRNDDETIIHKVKVASVVPYTMNDVENDETIIGDNVGDNVGGNVGGNVILADNNNLGLKWMLDIKENDLELEKLKIRLKYSTALRSKETPERDEYDYMKILNRQLKMQCKTDYTNSKEIHKHWILNPEKYFRDFNVWLNWYDFLGIDTSSYCQTKDAWRLFCLDIGVSSLEDYNKKSKIYKELPANPGQFYPHFNDTLTELGISIIRR